MLHTWICFCIGDPLQMYWENYSTNETQAKVMVIFAMSSEQNSVVQSAPCRCKTQWQCDFLVKYIKVFQNRILNVLKLNKNTVLARRRRFFAFMITNNKIPSDFLDIFENFFKKYINKSHWKRHCSQIVVHSQ